MACYRKGGCGPYEMLSCSECPASKPEYTLTKETLYVGILNGEIKDNFMAVGLTENSVKEKLIKAYFNEDNHTEADLEKIDIYINIISFNKSNSVVIF